LPGPRLATTARGRGAGGGSPAVSAVRRSTKSRYSGPQSGACRVRRAWQSVGVPANGQDGQAESGKGMDLR
jgi:hypothetical protein